LNNFLEDFPCEIQANENAWMTETLFLDWMNKIWQPHARKYPRSLIVMDQFRVHKMQSVLKRFSDLNTDILWIPAGMTHRLQPLDLYANKPLKDRLREKWEKYD
jgi:hypothetical protein